MIHWFNSIHFREELTKIADLCKKHNVICVSDEVYEWLIYDGNEHVRMCTLPGMWDRTITIGSAGKTFSVTGWKTGWAYGPAHLMANLEMVHQYCVDTIPTLIQEALAIMFEGQLECYDSPECYFRSLPAELKLKRDYMMDFLKSAGMKPILPQGGFFLVADWSPLGEKLLNIYLSISKKLQLTIAFLSSLCREKNRFVRRNRCTKGLSLHQMDYKEYWCSWYSTVGLLLWWS